MFQTRDEAVGKKDKKLFLSTQVDEIRDSGVDGYLSVKRMKGEVLGVISGDTKLSKKVVVRETYYTDKGKSHEGLIIYTLVSTVEGWKICGAVY